jgi:hypothetical protein
MKFPVLEHCCTAASIDMLICMKAPILEINYTEAVRNAGIGISHLASLKISAFGFKYTDFHRRLPFLELDFTVGAICRYRHIAALKG